MRVLLACSTGGHLSQLHALKPWWSQYDRRWMTFDKPDARSLLEGESIAWAYHPTTRSIPNLLRNTRVAIRELRRFRPDVVVSTGAGLAVPVFYLARLMGIRTVYVEVYDRIDSATLTGLLVKPVTDLFAVQWDEQLKMYPSATVIGHLM